MIDSGGDMIPMSDAVRWLTRIAAKDGVVSQNERRLLKEFADEYGLEEKIYAG